MLKYTNDELEDMKMEYKLDRMKEGMIRPYLVTFTICLKVYAIGREDAKETAEELVCNGDFVLKDIKGCDIERIEDDE